MSSELSRRDYFASAAMQAIISNHSLLDTVIKLSEGDLMEEKLAEMSVTQADALIEELVKRGFNHD